MVAIKIDTIEKLIISFILLVSGLSANKVYDVAYIPEDMLENAYTVTRLNETIVSIESYDKRTVQKHFAITLLSSKASYASNISIYYNEGIDKIKNLKIKIYDGQGNLVKKVKSKEISDVSIYDGFSMANDRRALNYQASYNRYPYTIEYEYEEESKFTAFIQPWSPSIYYYNAVEKSTYEIEAPQDYKINFKSINHEYAQGVVSIDSQRLNFSVENLKAVEPEENMPYRILPYTIFSPVKSVLDKTEVSYTDWKSFGSWMYNAYLNDKNDLSKEVVNELKASVAGMESEYEKAKAIYEVAVNSTRYISIQLGEGGWEPFYAQETHERKYGDCKALSMYTMSMMEAVGLNPFYVVIYGKSEYGLDLEEDFASIQGNHAIIGIPIEGDTIYTDCTNSNLPFAYKSGFTDGRIALAVDENGGKIVRTNKYTDSENREEIKTSISINPSDRILNLAINNKLEGLQIADRLHLNQFSKKEILEKVYPSFYPVYKTETFDSLDFSLINEKTVIESFKIESRNFISLAGDYLLLPLHIYNDEIDKINAVNRKYPIYFKDGYVKNYQYNMSIPNAYELGELPEDVVIKSEFGEWQFKVNEVSEVLLSYEVSISLKSGTYVPGLASEYNTWLDEIRKKSNQNITFKRSKK